MIDETEKARRERMAELAAEAAEREELSKRHGQVWSTVELTKDFKVLGFLAPFVVVEQRSTGKKGSLEFQGSPRYYFNWQEDR